jgi:hypothetical protein
MSKSVCKCYLVLSAVLAVLFVWTALAIAQSPGQGTALAGGGAHVLRMLVEKQGTEAQFDPNVTQMLGLTKEGKGLSLKQIGVRDDQDGIHAVNLLKPHGFLFVKISKNDSEVFHADDELKLLTALHKSGSGPFSSVPNIEAAPAFLDEMEFWAAVASWAPEKK